MGRRILANISPELLVWARENSGFTKEEVVHKLRTKSHKLDEWESGSAQPTINQLRKLAHIYKRPIAVFYLSERPSDFQPLRDFRRVRTGLEFKQTAQLYLEVRRADYRRDVALELMADMHEEIPQLAHRISIGDDPEEVGIRIRGLLKVPMSEQFGWRSEYEAFNTWRSAIENTGVLVFQSTGIDISEMRGFSISKIPLPVIGLNVSDQPRGKIFTLLHEYAHIMLDESGVCDILEHYERPEEEQRVETFCNYVAGAVLVPRAVLLEHEIVIRREREQEWDDGDLVVLSRQFKVSQEVILRRLLICGRTTDSFYQRKREEFLAQYEEISKGRKKGFPPVYRKVLNNTGISFAYLVLNSYYNERITSSDLSDYLEVRLKHLPKIEAEVDRKSRKYGVFF